MRSDRGDGVVNLNDARMFVQAVDRDGFSAAARALGVPKSTVSKRVAELERSLGITLVHRSSRRFVVTAAGQDFHRRASAMVALAEEAEAAVRGRLAEPSGKVWITSSVPTAQTWLAALLPTLAVKYPKLRIVHHATDRFVDLVREGFDMAVRAHFGPLPDSSLVKRRIGVDPLWLVASPRYLKQRGNPKRPEDLTSHDALLTHPTRPSFTLSFDLREPPTRQGRSTSRTTDASPGVTVAPSGRYFADETQMLLAAAKVDLGITAIPRRLCREELASGALKRVLPEWTAGQVTTTILVPERHVELPAVRVLSDALAAHLASEDHE